MQLIAGEILLGLVEIICYEDRIWMLPLQILLVPFITEWNRYRERRRRRIYALGFQDLLQSLMTSVQAGYNLENALRAALPELTEQRSLEKDPTLIQVRQILYGMEVGVPVERLFHNYARETVNEDIRQFAEVIEIAKHTGGNMVTILKNTMDHFRKKMAAEEEIRVILSGVVFEKNIMLFMPIVILIYMRLTNPEYMSCIYKTMTGHILISLVLGATVGCYYWTESLIQIKV